MTQFLFIKDNIIKYPLLNPYNKTKLNSIVIEFSYNEVTKDKHSLLPVYKTLMLLTGQKPKIIKAKDSIAAFRIRKDLEIGGLVTVRHGSKVNLLKLIILNLPKFKIKFYNLCLKSFDLFFPIDNRTGANIFLNISDNKMQKQSSKGETAGVSLTSKHFYLSSLHIF